MDERMPADESGVFSLRPTAQRDEKRVRALMVSGGMGLAPDWQDSIVAVDSADNPIGYLRVQRTSKGPHVAPIAVLPNWQGRGVGRALMKSALERHGCLKLVARGEVAGFYRTLGCREIGFEEISGELEEDCLHCADRIACQPVAFFIGKEDFNG